MRKAQREQVQECISLLQKAHELVRTSIHENQTSVANGLLEECQDAAIAIGTAVEKSEGLETKSVKLLENYCELIYSVHERLTAGEHVPAGNTFGKLRKLMEQIDQSIEDEVKIRKEVVFLPYKVSMWDSLESIWMATKDDETVDTYVVPIPYYDKNPDGSFGEMHYEGSTYPDYVSITNWWEYDIQERKPDVIFIHNPYDECNYVTSVHPDYYSTELKKYTQCLVYVPYFVLSGNEIGAEFINNNGVINADYVVCQSDKEKENYIDELKVQIPLEMLKKKIVALGSPKIDKVRNLNQNNTRIPDEWLQIIEKRKPKLVVLYNSSVGAMLRWDGNQYFQKMSKIFNNCAEDNILIIWRPHPLMEPTLKSMRSDYYVQYIKMKDTFDSNKVGVLDESDNMYPAILISDVYIGDWSSIIWLYMETGKPIAVSYENSIKFDYYMSDDRVEKDDVYITLSKTVGNIFEKWNFSRQVPIKDSGERIYQKFVKGII